jgi:transglutaminase-like putative cysteine protease
VTGALALPRRATASARALPRPEVARLLAFVPLALFGALHWGALIEPARAGDLLVALAAAVAGGVVLVSVAPEASPWRRHGIGAAVAVALFAVALLTAGVPVRFLEPRHWDELVGGLAQGIGSTPAVTVPYRGIDDWTRIAIVVGGTGLVCLAALLAFWPRRAAAGAGSRAPLSVAALAPARHGRQLAAAVALGTLYGVPIVEHAPTRPYLGGAVFCIFMAAFLWLERLRADQVGAAGASIVLAAAVGAAVAPRLDGPRPWFDYQAFAAGLEPKHAEVFNWDHRYGPLTWPRDGRELLRIKAKTQVYWKAANLDEFDGFRWLQAPASRNEPAQPIQRQWLQHIKVVDRGLRSLQFVGAGQTRQILPGASQPALPVSGGTFVTAGKPLQPGDSYEALVYTPRPTDAQLRRSGTDYPGYVDDYLQTDLPVRGAAAQILQPDGTTPIGASATLQFPRFGAGSADGDPSIVYRTGAVDGAGNGGRVISDSPYARLYALAHTMAHQARTPYQFALAVRNRVEQGADYDESPPRAAYPLASFLFKERRGYCQQFSGVMALMLRMGGVPARVASGFSPGGIDRDRKEFVVRDTDAHSWVEAYFPPYGWITMDPTPASAPALSQLDDTPSFPGSGSAVTQGRLGQSGDRPFAGAGSGAPLAPPDRGTDWKPPAVAALLALLAAFGGWRLWRRGRLPLPAAAPELAELQRALHRSGRLPGPQVTLARLEGLLAGSDAGAGYVRALRELRYGGRGTGPTAAQRRALRRQLAAGLGAAGRLRALWALPPALPRRSGRGGRRRSYTGA